METSNNNKPLTVEKRKSFERRKGKIGRRKGLKRMINIGNYGSEERSEEEKRDWWLNFKKIKKKRELKVKEKKRKERKENRNEEYGGK